jgi:hypothetical protein
VQADKPAGKTALRKRPRLIVREAGDCTNDASIGPERRRPSHLRRPRGGYGAVQPEMMVTCRRGPRDMPRSWHVSPRPLHDAPRGTHRTPRLGWRRVALQATSESGGSRVTLAAEILEQVGVGASGGRCEHTPSGKASAVKRPISTAGVEHIPLSSDRPTRLCLRPGTTAVRLISEPILDLGQSRSINRVIGSCHGWRAEGAIFSRQHARL